MYALSAVTICSIFLPLISALSRRVINDPVSDYLFRMCYPLESNATFMIQAGSLSPSTLANSPFPCEQSAYLLDVCLSNGTTVIDFLAEQECLCNGNYFSAVSGCYDCYFAHGEQGDPEQSSSHVASLSTAECSPSPPYQGFTNLFPPVNFTSEFISISLAPSMTLGDDKFPNNTAVSNYFTGTGLATPGAITGSATARVTTWTNTNYSMYYPTSTPSGFGTVGSASTSSGGSGSKTSTSSASASKSSTNIAARDEVYIGGGIFAAALGICFML